MKKYKASDVNVLIDGKIIDDTTVNAKPYPIIIINDTHVLNLIEKDSQKKGYKCFSVICSNPEIKVYIPE